MIAYIFAALGFAAIFYGLSPLADSHPFGGYVSERGCIAALIGIGIVSFVGVVKVMG